jgi:hypothetical protein
VQTEFPETAHPTVCPSDPFAAEIHCLSLDLTGPGAPADLVARFEYDDAFTAPAQSSCGTKAC